MCLVSKDQGGGGNRIFKGWKNRARAAKCKQTNKKLHSSSSFLEGYRGMFFPDDNVETGNAVEIIIPALNELNNIVFNIFVSGRYSSLSLAHPVSSF